MTIYLGLSRWVCVNGIRNAKKGMANVGCAFTFFIIRYLLGAAKGYLLSSSVSAK